MKSELPNASTETLYESATSGVQTTRAEFEEKLKQSYRQVYGLAFRLTANSADAEDLTQEAFIRAYRFYHRYDASLPFLNWICRILANLHVDFARKKSRFRPASLVVSGDGVETQLDVPDWTSMPDREMNEQMVGEALQEGLQSVNPAFRTAVVLADVEGMEYEEIAQVMKTSIGTVRSRIHRGRGQLKRYLLKKCPNLYERYIDEL